MTKPFLSKSHNGVAFDMDARHGIKDSSIALNEITDINNLTLQNGEFSLSDGSFDIPLLFKHAPPIPHSGGQTVHEWGIILEINALTSMTIEATNFAKGFKWTINPTTQTLTVGDKTLSNMNVPWGEPTIFQQVNNGSSGSYIYTPSKLMTFSIPNAVVFGGMKISGTVDFTRIRILKGVITPSYFPTVTEIAISEPPAV